MGEHVLPSGIDRIFNIPDSTPGHQAMAEYLDSRHPTADDLLTFGLRMWHADHPAINYVGAHAAAEIALKRFKPVSDLSGQTLSFPPSMGLRMLTMDIAAKQWTKAEAMREEFSDVGLPSRRRQEALSIAVSSLQAQAYRPNMEIASSWFADHPDFYTADETAERRRKTLALTAQYCQEVMGWPHHKLPPFNRESKGRIMTDLLGGAVLQLSDRYLIFPTLLRLAGGYDRVRFSNLGFVAIPTQPPHQQIMIRTFFGESSRKTKSIEIRLEDIAGSSDAPMGQTVEELAHYSATGELTPNLGRLGDELTARLDNYSLTYHGSATIS